MDWRLRLLGIVATIAFLAVGSWLEVRSAPIAGGLR